MIVKRDFLYTPTNQNRPLHIWLPDGYGQSEQRYPVMYFFDGHNLFSDEDATYGKCWGLKDFLEGWHKQLIVVGIECGHGAGERLSEYLPYPAIPNTFCDGCEVLGDATLRWMVEELKPVIDADYRTYSHRTCTAIAGSSMGGLMALYGGVHHNDVFSKAACISSSIGICMEPLRADLETSPIDPDSRFYLSWGTKEAWGGVADIWAEDTESLSYHQNRETAERIAAKGAAAKLRCQIGGGHCEADWEKLVPDFMQFLWLSHED